MVAKVYIIRRVFHKLFVIHIPFFTAGQNQKFSPEIFNLFKTFTPGALNIFLPIVRTDKPNFQIFHFFTAYITITAIYKYTHTNRKDFLP